MFPSITKHSAIRKSHQGSGASLSGRCPQGQGRGTGKEELRVGIKGEKGMTRESGLKEITLTLGPDFNISFHGQESS
jgi:hypothetical protein